jgi:hypothetical protein
MSKQVSLLTILPEVLRSVDPAFVVQAIEEMVEKAGDDALGVVLIGSREATEVFARTHLFYFGPPREVKR